MTSQWTPEAIRALGATTDLPTLGSIFGLGRWRRCPARGHARYSRPVSWRKTSSREAPATCSPVSAL